MKKEDLQFLGQLIRALEEASLKLEEAYNNKDYEALSSSKRIISQIHEKISEIVK